MRIERGIPLPPKGRHRAAKSLSGALARQMQPGESAASPDERDILRLQDALRYHGKKYVREKQFDKKTGKFVHRIWCVADTPAEETKE